MSRPHPLLPAIVLCVGCAEPQVWRYAGTVSFEYEDSWKEVDAAYELCARAQNKTDIFGSSSYGPNKALVWELDDQCAADVLEMFGVNVDCSLDRIDPEPPEFCTSHGEITGSIDPLE